MLSPNCSLCTYVCSHFGCTNVCYFSFVFCLISPIFYLILFLCDVILRGFGFSLPSTTTTTAAVAAIDVLMLTLSLTLLHTSGLQYNMVPVPLPLPSSSSKILFFFSIPATVSFSSSCTFSPSLSLIAPGRVERAPCHLR